MKKIYLTLLLIFISTNAFAAQTQIAQVNGMMCIKCQKMVGHILFKKNRTYLKLTTLLLNFY